MLKYREHRGTLEESLATTKEFNTLSEIITYIKVYCSDMIQDFKPENFIIKPYGYDSRCDQKLFIVSSDQGVHGFIFEEN